MGLAKYLAQIWEKPKENIGVAWKTRLVKWRQEPAILKVDSPLRPDKAHRLGYRAKKGFVVARVRLARGGRKREWISSGRKSHNSRMMKIVEKNYRAVAEQRCQDAYTNLEVLDSYYVGDDGKNFWYEIIMVDPCAPEIKADKRISWICSKRGRVYRGLTSASRKSRGLRNKGKGAEKMRPSTSANKAKMIRRYGKRRG
ncbi:MAG: 50S ribosomal protein L15e [Candidatus Nanoarchaeia archaeon]|nr:50S ribosomal protein L15e [Candidatus Nanoarchaeia archaeon]